ncbi:uncharacterized protein Bfra_006887, partial [Botrytis fragariae]
YQILDPGPPSPLRIRLPVYDTPHKASLSIKSRSYDDGLIMYGYEDSSCGFLKPLLPSIPPFKPLIGP